MFRYLNSCRKFSNFVPKHEPVDSTLVDTFKQFLLHYDDILVLTGAGISTESGIPDYRSEEVGVFARSSYKPIWYSQFMKNPDARTRYWARNFVGWPRFSTFQPNKAHMFLANMQTSGSLSHIITQNVDGLHSKAGSKNVVELHGNAFWVSCVKCGDMISRFDFQTVLEQCNPYMKTSSSELRPDGDVELAEEDVKNFKVPDCEKCGGILKPTVVFFGENVPEKVVKEVEGLVDNCEAMLILGTTLSTLSSYRLVLQAYDASKYLCVVNIGPTRGDKLADLRINAKITDLMPDRKPV